MDQQAECTAPNAGRQPRITVLDQRAGADDGSDVVAGLTGQPKTLPPRYFYDAAGSDLFDRICDLPEYYPTRTEESILRGAAPEIAALAPARTLVELGSGSARKIRLLIDAFAQRYGRLGYLPIDVSRAAIEGNAADLMAEFPDLQVEGLVGTYERALAELAARNVDAEPKLVLFLGSTIGNFAPEEAEAFLDRLRGTMRAGDFLLIGIDLRKDVNVIEAAYNDSRGVTAAFNRNMLRHLTRIFDGNFVPERFDHLAFYNPDEHQIEMHLRSRIGQSVALKALNFRVDFQPGETIRTEISRKFDLDEFESCLNRRGFAPIKHWTDAKAWFGLCLGRAR